MLNITDIHITLRSNLGDHIKALATITIDNCFVIKGLAVREHKTEKYFFVTFPYRINVIDHHEIRVDVAHPITEECRREIQNKVLGRLRRNLH